MFCTDAKALHFMPQAFTISAELIHAADCMDLVLLRLCRDPAASEPFIAALNQLLVKLQGLHIALMKPNREHADDRRGDHLSQMSAASALNRLGAFVTIVDDIQGVIRMWDEQLQLLGSELNNERQLREELQRNLLRAQTGLGFHSDRVALVAAMDELHNERVRLAADAHEEPFASELYRSVCTERDALAAALDRIVYSQGKTVVAAQLEVDTEREKIGHLMEELAVEKRSRVEEAALYQQTWRRTEVNRSSFQFKGGYFVCSVLFGSGRSMVGLGCLFVARSRASDA